MRKYESYESSESVVWKDSQGNIIEDYDVLVQNDDSSKQYEVREYDNCLFLVMDNHNMIPLEEFSFDDTFKDDEDGGYVEMTLLDYTIA